MNPAPLTRKQALVLHFMREFQVRNGSMPTRKEIAAHFDWSSPQAAEDHIVQLRRRDLITTVPGAARGIRFTEQGLAIVGALSPTTSAPENMLALPVIDMGRLNNRLAREARG